MIFISEHFLGILKGNNYFLNTGTTHSQQDVSFNKISSILLPSYFSSCPFIYIKSENLRCGSLRLGTCWNQTVVRERLHSNRGLVHRNWLRRQRFCHGNIYRSWRYLSLSQDLIGYLLRCRHVNLWLMWCLHLKNIVS